ncbi:MAG: hypothetical protein WCS03_06055 [Bacteroidota bacterium]
MKTFIKLLIILGIVFSSAVCCKKIPQKETSSTAKIILLSCGGTVIQFLDSDSIVGETWDNFFSNPVVIYTNCSLVGNLAMSKFKEGDTINFNYEKVIFFETGIFCNIGGLPKIKIEISDVVKINK